MAAPTTTANAARRRDALLSFLGGVGLGSALLEELAEIALSESLPIENGEEVARGLREARGLALAAGKLARVWAEPRRPRPRRKRA